MPWSRFLIDSVVFDENTLFLLYYAHGRSFISNSYFSKAFRQQFHFIKATLRRTLENPPRRRAKFHEFFGDEEGEHFVHELDQSVLLNDPNFIAGSMSAAIANGRNGSNTSHSSSSPQPLPTSEDHEAGTTPDPHTLDQEVLKGPPPRSASLMYESEKRHSLPRKRAPSLRARRTSSRKLLKTFQIPFMKREDSFSRDQRVIKDKRVILEMPKLRSLTEDICSLSIHHPEPSVVKMLESCHGPKCEIFSVFII